MSKSSTTLTTIPATAPSLPPENFRYVVAQNGTLIRTSTTNSTYKPAYKSPFSNGTGYYIEEENEPGLSDLQTLVLACVATFIPLIIILLSGFGIRLLWRKYRRYRECNNYDGNVLQRDENSEHLSKPLCTHLYNSEQMKCSETHLSITGDDVEICDASTPVASGPQTTHSTSHSSTNGSIITMTLKNNHLIVETEERNDLEEDSRETTMKYSHGARDGVFVVEVQQGGRRNSGHETKSLSVDGEPSVSYSNQRALIHNPPDKYINDVNDASNLTKSDVPLVKFKTGLSQSNSSLSSSSTQAYRYGNQEGYDLGYYGYSFENGHTTDGPACISSDANKPKIISEILKSRQNSKYSSESEETFRQNSVVNQASVDVDDHIQQEQARLGNSICANKSSH